ncbi:MAG TPA: hypothetical protein VMV83_04290 [Rectinemataceae bacterium]|nr:hypothetical protein [Rectinemataceae bacterium]
MKRFFVALSVAVIAILGMHAQTVSFGLGDTGLEASLNVIGASAKVDMGGFTAEVSLQWGTSPTQVQTALSQGLQPAEVYLAAALANMSGKSLTFVVGEYKKNKAKGWGALAKSLGIKPGSKEFKALKDKSSASSDKAKKKKK